MICFRPISNVPGTSSSPVTVNIPSYVVNGDLMLMVLVSVNPTNTFSTPSGWTLAGTSLQSAGLGQCIALFYRTASSEPSSYSVTLTGNHFVTGFVACAFDSSGATVAYDTLTGNASGSSSTSFTLGSITPASGNVDPLSMIMAVVSCSSSPPDAYSTNGHPFGTFYQNALLSEINSIGAWFYPTAKGVATATQALQAQSSGNWAGMSIALKITGSPSTDRIALAGSTGVVNAGPVTSQTVQVPNNVVNGDFMVMLAYAAGASIACSGWSVVTTADSGKLALLTRTAS